MMKRDWRTVWILTALLVLALLAVRLVFAAPTGACGDGLAAQDLAGTCRALSPTPGALEAVAPARIPPTPGGVILERR